MAKHQAKRSRFKFTWLPLSAAGLFAPLTIVACGSANGNSASQAWIDQKYQNFQNASLIDQNQLWYVEYFDQSNRNAEGWFEIPPSIIAKILSIRPLDPQPLITEQYLGKIEGEESGRKKLVITYKLFKNNREQKPSFVPKNQQIENLHELTTTQHEAVQKVLDEWQKHTIEIKNGNNSLDASKYNTIPTTLLKTDRDDESNQFFQDTLKTFVTTKVASNTGLKTRFSLAFNDKDITIRLDLVLDEYLELPIVTKTPEQQIKTVSGFKANKTYQDEVKTIYEPLGRYYDLSEFNNQKPYEQLASSIYDINELGVLIKTLNKLKSDKFPLPDFFDDSKKDKLWYELETSINANDINGTVNIDFTLVDKFTQTEIRPQNLTKIMTLTKFYPLVQDRDNQQDYAIMENVFQAYQKFENLELKDNQKNQKLPSNETDPIDKNWLTSNTDGFESGEFSVSFTPAQPDKPSTIRQAAQPDNQITNTFKVIKIDNNTTKKTQSKQVLNDDVNGIKQIPVVLQIKLDMSSDPVQPYNKANEKWYTVLPHSKSGVNEDEFTSKSEEIKYIKIGGYRTKDINISHKIYNLFTNTQANPPLQTSARTIELEVGSRTFNALQEKTQKAAVALLEEQQIITDKVKDILKTSSDAEIKNKVDELINKFNFLFDLQEVPWEAEEDNPFSQPSLKLKLKTAAVDLKLTSKTNSDHVFDNIGTDGQASPFPKVQIVVKLKSS